MSVGGEVDNLTIEKFLLSLTLILVFSKVFGELAERVKQPSVLGELVAGVILGASVLALVPSSHGQLGYETFHLLAEVGVAILLFEIGLETDLKDLIKVGPTSALVAIIGVALPFVFGFLSVLGFQKFGLLNLDPTFLILVAITTGATLTATSVGITARVLSDMNKLQTSESRIILGAAVIDDILGLIILGVVTGLIESFENGNGSTVSLLNIGLIMLKAFGFLSVSIVAGNLIAPKLFKFFSKLKVRGLILLFAVSFAFIYSILANYMGLAPIVGAFAAGLVLRNTSQFQTIEHNLRPVSDFFTPIFFVTIGASVDISVFNPFVSENIQVLLIALILFVVAVVGKFASGFSVFQKGINKSVIGVGMIPRGEVGLIFAQVGLSHAIFDSKLFSAITAMVMLTTFIAPPLLQKMFKESSYKIE
ncbi:MAG: cation:proton antiporter [Thermodesulfobacteriota bacterium]